tara:strand:+ start:231 stop:491 length:261 start_codon:yes stop_codon:yes gene_type:complete
VLAGVGGRTIAEAKQALSYREVQQWMAYMRKRGTLAMQRRMEWPFALLAMYLNRLGGGQADMADFMPYASADDQEISLNEAMERWQ